MKCTIPEISWHNREPILSVDLNPIFSEFYKLATGGGDSHVLIWQMSLSENGAIKQEVISDLKRHQRAVNVVRWSPSGLYLATGDDDANIILWQQKIDNIPLLEGDTDDKEIWIVKKVFRGHKEDIYDLCWSIDNLKLLSGSVDNTAILWDLEKNKMDHIISDHKGFVQGVAWDPKNQIIATISTDRFCRVFDITGKQVKSRIHKGQLPVPSNHYLYQKNVKYFHDDTFKSFFRRLQFSPDGSLLIVPSGHIESDDCKKIMNTTLLFSMDNLTEPAAVLPLTKQSSTVVRCCPILFELHADGPDPLINLPYRMIFAVGTDHDIILYDTQQYTPFARFQEIHYTRLTDLTWSQDGLLLTASSTDGFCSLITFDLDELGIPYMKEDSELEDNAMDISGCEEIVDKDENIDINNKDGKSKNETEKKIKKSNFFEQWTQNTKKRRIQKCVRSKENEGIIEIIDDNDDHHRTQIKEEINILIPRKSTYKNTENIESENKSSKLIAQPIHVKRKSSIVEQKSQREFSTGEDNKQTFLDAKPIAVRRKPKLESNDTLKQSKQETINSSTASTSSPNTIIIDTGEDNKQTFLDAKPIAVRQKFKIESKNTIKQSNQEIIHSGTVSVSSPNTSIIDDVLGKTQNKIVEEKEKNSEHNKNEQVSDGCAVNNKNVSRELFGKQKEYSETKRNEKSDFPTIVRRRKIKNHNTLGKQEKPRNEDVKKIKVSSLIKKQSSPNKSNPLLNFLKNDGKNKRNSKNSKILDNIDLTVNEDDARDAWKCDKNSGSQTNEINAKSNIIPMEEDYTEDFCLQLEESQDSKTVDSKHLETNCELDSRVNDHVSLLNEGKINYNKQEKIKESPKISISSNTSSGSSVKTVSNNVINLNDNIERKVPRRVQLTTLSSPKGKTVLKKT